MSIVLAEINTQKEVEIHEDLPLFEGMKQWVTKEYSFPPTDDQVLDYFLGYRIIGHIDAKPEDLNKKHYSLAAKDLVIHLKDTNKRVIFLSHRLRCS